MATRTPSPFLLVVLPGPTELAEVIGAALCGRVLRLPIQPNVSRSLEHRVLVDRIEIRAADLDQPLTLACELLGAPSSGEFRVRLSPLDDFQRGRLLTVLAALPPESARGELEIQATPVANRPRRPSIPVPAEVGLENPLADEFRGAADVLEDYLDEKLLEGVARGLYAGEVPSEFRLDGAGAQPDAVQSSRTWRPSLRPSASQASARGPQAGRDALAVAPAQGRARPAAGGTCPSPARRRRRRSAGRSAASIWTSLR
ncbi:MAG: hypothetical protein HY744_01050 [Deltaproteobacteria bacterium]|nr:hypothetical protein [Deltaproteobacteria bacterium]